MARVVESPTPMPRLPQEGKRNAKFFSIACCHSGGMMHQTIFSCGLLHPCTAVWCWLPVLLSVLACVLYALLMRP